MKIEFKSESWKWIIMYGIWSENNKMFCNDIKDVKEYKRIFNYLNNLIGIFVLY